ncbi:MAG: hypothetical protein GWP06_12970 [Actinobacteria bacterium]|nr:hypothetical protein [Actinomycetota bacterium]
MILFNAKKIVGKTRRLSRKITAIFIALFFIALSPIGSIAQTVYVPSDHWVYDFLDRMETRGIVPSVLANTKPLTRQEIATYVVELLNSHAAFSRAESEQLEFLCREFAEEIPPQNTSCRQKNTSRLSRLERHKWIDPWLPDAVYANGRNFLSMTSGPLKAYWDPVFLRSAMTAQADTLPQTEQVFQAANGFVLWGTVGNHIGFYSNVRDTKEWGTRTYPHGNFSTDGLGFAQGHGNYMYHDETVAYLVYTWKYFNIQFGKDKNRWGPGYYGQLALSDIPTSYDQIKLQYVARRIKFTSLMGFLKNYTPDYFYGDAQEKYLAAHRLEFSPIKQLDIGLSETIIFAGRKFEPAYLNPMMFFRSAEHYLGDRDNATMGLDFELKIIADTKLYGELFIDDISTGKLGSGFYGNKYAFLAGLYHVDIFGIPNLDVHLEYAHVRPYTYTHKEDITSYRHFTTNLGHRIGPNADDLFCELRYRTSRRLLIKSQFEIKRHGANTENQNVGGSIFRPHTFPADPQYVDFLQGIREKTSSIGIVGSYEVIRNSFIEISYFYESYKGRFSGSVAKSQAHRSALQMTMKMNF